MARERSAGCLVFRQTEDDLEFLLVHPSKATFKKRLFGIPKGLIEEGESEEATAVRETCEETGLQVEIIADLGTCRYRTSGKEIRGFLARMVSGVVDEKGSTPHDWEVDVSKFYPPATCRKIIHPDQEAFLDRALDYLNKR
jgi:8-oxo-dGTP diphosphatase